MAVIDVKILKECIPSETILRIKAQGQPEFYALYIGSNDARLVVWRTEGGDKEIVPFDRLQNFSVLSLRQVIPLLNR